MAIINAGGFAQVPVPLGYALSISGAARVYVAPPRPASLDGGPFVVNDARDVIGPFPVSVTLNIEATGDVSYSVVMSPLVGDPVVSRTDPTTGAVSLVSGDGSRVDAFGSLLSRYGVVANGTTDDASNLQEAILAANAAGIPCALPPDISVIKCDSGLILDAAKTRFTAPAKCTLDFSGMTSGNAILLDCSVTNSNLAPLDNITNEMGGFKLLGGAAAGVTAIKVRSTTGYPYFYLFHHISADNFALTVDLGANCFGTGFEDVAFRAASGINNTLIQCLTGDGSNYGERFNFTRAMLYNSGRILLNTNAATTFRFLNSSFDYSDVMADIQAGRVSLESCHIETNKDTDYLFKLSGNESSALTLDKCEFVLNGINRTSYELFDIATAVKHGGIFVRDTMISHGAGYSLASYVRGAQRAVASGLMTFTAQAKPTFSRHMGLTRDLAAASASAGAEWTLSTAGASPAPAYTTSLPASAPLSAAWGLSFGGGASSSTAEIVLPLGQPGQQLRTSWYYHKSDASPTAGQGKIQMTLDFLDSKGTGISLSLIHI